MDKKSFAESLGQVLFTDSMANSYYNDECYVNCLTPDYNKAYQTIKSKKEITEEDLDSTTFYKGEDDKKEISFSGLDLIKITILGDFHKDFENSSDRTNNLSCIHALTISLKGGEKVWTKYTKNRLSEDPWGMGMSQNEHVQALVQSTPLTTLAYNKIAWFTTSISLLNNPQNLQNCRKISEKLKDYAGFEERDENKKNIIQNIYLKLPNDEKELLLKEIRRIATYTKNQQYAKIMDKQAQKGNFGDKTEPIRSSIRKAALRHILLGNSCDELFETTTKNIVGIKEKLKKTIKKEDSVEL